MKSKSKMKSAISLIILVVTILVVSIIAAAVIISLSNTNIMSQASNTVFKQDMANFKETYEMYVTSKLADNANFDRTTLNVAYVTTPKEFEEIFGNEVSDRYKNNLQIVKGRLVYVTEDETEKAILEELGISSTLIEDIISKEPTTSTTPTPSPYIGYFADVDGDGKVDGVIFADLLEGWIDSSYTNEWRDLFGGFDMTSQKVTKSEVKDYYISQDSYEVAGAPGYGDKPVLTATGSGKDRFYVMSLSDFTSSDGYSKFYWYYALDEKADKSRTDTKFGTGKENTFKMISDWNAGSKNEMDMWGAIQSKVYGNKEKTLENVKWFIPSSQEWNAFCYAFNLSDSNYKEFNLSNYYWASSINSKDTAFYATFYNSYSTKYLYGMGTCYFILSNAVRFAVTF